MSRKDRVLVGMMLGAVSAALGIVGCGQITGLSDDYTYDLADGATSSDGAAGDAKTDGGTSTDGAVGTGDAGSPTCKTQATAYLTTENAGSVACRTCVANNCCTGVNACSQLSACRNDLKCVLDCSTSDTGRQSCVSKCQANQGNGFGVLYQCMQQNCASPCL